MKSLYIWLPEKLHILSGLYCFFFLKLLQFWINDSNAYLADLIEANKIRCALWCNTEWWQEQLLGVHSAELRCAAVAQITDWIRMPTWRLCGASVLTSSPERHLRPQTLPARHSISVRVVLSLLQGPPHTLRPPASFLQRETVKVKPREGHTPSCIFLPPCCKHYKSAVNAAKQIEM